MDSSKPSRRNSKIYKIIERTWASSIILYSFGATIVVWKGLSRYGVNPILFFVIDVCTSWPYGIATARIVLNVIERRWSEVRKWSWVAVITFVTPQVYILAAAKHPPREVYIIIFSVVTAMAVFAIVSLGLQIRTARSQQGKEISE
jgi:hypothetical protein